MLRPNKWGCFPDLYKCRSLLGNEGFMIAQFLNRILQLCRSRLFVADVPVSIPDIFSFPQSFHLRDYKGYQ